MRTEEKYTAENAKAQAEKEIQEETFALEVAQIKREIKRRKERSFWARVFPWELSLKWRK